MSNYTHVAIGCSHTRAIYMPSKDHWSSIVYRNSEDYFEYWHASKIGSGLIHLELRLETLPVSLDNMKFLVIQKPQPIRFPWWIDNWQDVITRSSYGELDFVRGRKYSTKTFNRLSNKRQKKVAQRIFDEEFQCLVRIRQRFPDTRIAYYYYWGDCILDQLHNPNLAHINTELGGKVVDLNIENWGTIIDPHIIPGVYDEEGDILMDMGVLFRSGWIASKTDQHPGLKFHELVARKVLEWMPH